MQLPIQINMELFKLKRRIYDPIFSLTHYNLFKMKNHCLFQVSCNIKDVNFLATNRGSWFWFVYIQQFVYFCRKSAPKFLLDVYKRLNDESNDRASRVTRSIDDDENEHFITDTDNDAIHESDIIMTFLNKSEFTMQLNCIDTSISNYFRFSSQENHVAEVRHEHGRKLWFDVSEVSPDSMLMMAELRIFQNPSLGRWKELQKEFNISVYVVTKSDKYVMVIEI